MIRRFNSTGRRWIPSAHAAVTLRRLDADGDRGDDGPDDGRRAETGDRAPEGLRARTGAPRAETPKWCFDLDLDLDRYKFPPDARLRVEAWRGNAFQRWDWGTVGAPARLNDAGRALQDVPETCQFRVSVIAADGSGLLLGLADKLRPMMPVESLLPLVPADLGSEVWRLDYGLGDDMVVLKVNEKLPDFDGTVRGNAVFRGLVMPQVLRSVLERAALVDREDPADRDGRWAPWFALARNILPGREPPTVGPDAPDDQVAQADEWIEAVVAEFSARHVKALEGCEKAWQER